MQVIVLPVSYDDTTPELIGLGIEATDSVVVDTYFFIHNIVSFNESTEGSTTLRTINGDYKCMCHIDYVVKKISECK